jgi:hypothetical protein
VRARPVGIGAACAACADRRRLHLRYYELDLRANAPGGRWVVLCHNCCAVAEKVQPPPRSIEGLKMRLGRERRWGDRRAAAVGVAVDWPAQFDRRRDRRRDDDRAEEIDAGDLVEEVIEIVADYEQISEDQLADIGEVTGIHQRV